MEQRQQSLKEEKNPTKTWLPHLKIYYFFFFILHPVEQDGGCVSPKKKIFTARRSADISILIDTKVYRSKDARREQTVRKRREEKIFF